MLGLGFLSFMLLACLGSLPYTLSAADDQSASPRYNDGDPKAGRIPPSWAPLDESDFKKLTGLLGPERLGEIAERTGVPAAELAEVTPETGPEDAARALADAHERWALGTDVLGRSLLLRCLAGGGISLGIGIAAAMLSVFIGTLYGALSGYAGGLIDAFMMRIVDILYGLPYILLVVLLAVAVDASVERMVMAGRDISPFQSSVINLATLLVAIGGVSWLTMARVVRGQVLSLKNQPFVEAARAVGAPTSRIFLKHLLPNLLGPIIVYATLTVPQAILQESFLSFLGIGVKPPMPSWGNLAADGLSELNTYKSNWWLLLFPCLLLGSTLLALNFVGEGLREAFDPKRARAGGGDA